MSGIKKWFKDRAIAMSLAMSNVEKTFLAQDGKPSDEGTKQERRHSQGTLADDLMRGELSQEVKDLRWRTYKIMKNIKGLKLNSEYETIKTAENLSNIKIDDTDPYELELVVVNDSETNGLLENNVVDVSSYEYLISIKNEKPIKISRGFFPKFSLEKFTSKLNVRKVSETEKLLEFYITKYPNEYDKTFNLFLKEIKRVIEGTKSSNFLEIDEVGFISDLLYYEYKIKSFYKIIEFNGNYVIKYLAEITTNGEDILKDFVEQDLEHRYETKEAKKIKI